MMWLKRGGRASRRAGIHDAGAGAGAALRGVVVLLLALAGIAAGACGDDGGANDNTNGNQGGPGVCGDGVLDAAEQCDDGPDNSDSRPDACRSDCREAYCGDGVMDTGEGCDEGGANSDRIPGACRRDCTPAGCGDGVLDPAEACDDGNTEAGDGCGTQCRIEPNWSCQGMPSTCACQPYFRGEGCAQCVVFVDGEQTGAADGAAWATAFARVQQGIDTAAAAAMGAVAGASCEVWVAAGSYGVYRFSPFNTVRLRDGVAIYGGFLGTETQRAERDPAANPTILEGAGSPPQTAVYHVVTAVDTLDATLDGFRVQGGRAVGSDPGDRRGAGLTVRNARVTIQRCEIRDNRADHGAGVASEGASLWMVDSAVSGNRATLTGGGLWGHAASVMLDGVTVSGNHAEGSGGGVHLHTGAHLLDGCVFESNTATARGGAVYNEAAWTVFQDTDFVANQLPIPPADVVNTVPRGGAVFLEGDTAPDFINCLFQNNSAGYGGALYAEDAAPTIRQSTFVQNEATDWDADPAPSTASWIGGEGAGLYIRFSVAHLEDTLLADNFAWWLGGAVAAEQGGAHLLHCTVADNYADFRGGGVSHRWADTTDTTVVNSILWGNRRWSSSGDVSSQLHSYGNATGHELSGHHGLVEGGSTLITNVITGEPRFVDAAGGDYHLQASSPAIDAADDAVATAADRDGNPRTSPADLGCYEHQP